jgi:hypothetical protein
MRLLIISSCTDKKSLHSSQPLVQADFARGPKHLAEREHHHQLVPAGALYAGRQHTLLMEGIAAARTNGWSVDLRIVSAGYGLIQETRPIAPYNVTFTGMARSELDRWAQLLNLSHDFRAVTAKGYDLALVLLGGHYARAAGFSPDSVFGGPAIAVVHSSGKKRPAAAVPRNFCSWNLAGGRSRGFMQGNISIKGEVARRLLWRLPPTREAIADLMNPAIDHLRALAADPSVP